jgi:hypothetical protein
MDCVFASLGLLSLLLGADEHDGSTCALGAPGRAGGKPPDRQTRNSKARADGRDENRGSINKRHTTSACLHVRAHDYRSLPCVCPIPVMGTSISKYKYK